MPVVPDVRGSGIRPGMQAGELFGLTWGDGVDLDGGTVTIRSETSKGRSERTLPLMPDLVEMLRAWRAANPDETHVLPSRGDARRLYEIGIRLLATGYAKNCRSSAGTQLIEAGIPTAIAQKWLGHK